MKLLQGMVLLCVLGAPSMLSANGTVYEYVDSKGIRNFTNLTPPGGVKARVVFRYCPACDPASTVNWRQIKLNRDAYNADIRRIAQAHSVDEALVRAVIHAESAFNPNALSSAGAQGLMQLMPATGRQYGVTDAWDPIQNIEGGVRYLRFLLDFFDGDTQLATAGYNAGENAVLRFSGIPPYAETQVYVQRVGVLYERYQAELLAEAATAPTVPAQAAVGGTAGSAP